MTTKIVIQWDDNRSRCPHKTITFLEDDRVVEERIECDQVQHGDLLVNTPSGRTQVLKPFSMVICDCCNSRGTIMLEGEPEAFVEDGQICFNCP
ncbi:hypothetical protein [Salmonella phage SKML-39]|uniref:Uncharacterized protein n=1 Tax=Salmonella phage SKML-39 TaxID=1204528 RepID=K4I309_9CAUD|nr:hypothetical protein G178_gp063 [Salmonella phage SKML-39]AFU64406.1 hypothetical protein [Salmonella phage SKML-39]